MVLQLPAQRWEEGKKQQLYGGFKNVLQILEILT